MKMKKIPLRTCIVSGEKLEKKDLFRIVRTPEGQVVVDESYKTNGRGAYLKKDINVIEKAKKSKALDRHLETSVEDSIYEELINKLN